MSRQKFKAAAIVCAISGSVLQTSLLHAGAENAKEIGGTDQPIHSATLVRNLGALTNSKIKNTIETTIVFNNNIKLANREQQVLHFPEKTDGQLDKRIYKSDQEQPVNDGRLTREEFKNFFYYAQKHPKILKKFFENVSKFEEIKENTIDEIFKDSKKTDILSYCVRWSDPAAYFYLKLDDKNLGFNICSTSYLNDAEIFKLLDIMATHAPIMASLKRELSERNSKNNEKYKDPRKAIEKTILRTTLIFDVFNEEVNTAKFGKLPQEIEERLRKEIKLSGTKLDSLSEKFFKSY